MLSAGSFSCIKTATEVDARLNDMREKAERRRPNSIPAATWRMLNAGADAPRIPVDAVGDTDGVMTANVPETPAAKLSGVAKVQAGLYEAEWFTKGGAYVLVDGQFGSTGKGLCEQVLGMLAGRSIDVITTNAGPNSGHTTYSHLDGRKIVTKQIPSIATTLVQKGHLPPLYLNAGAIIDPEVLEYELKEFPMLRGSIFVHPHAAAILPEHKNENSNLAHIASTQKGTGPALAAKIMRDRFAVVENRHEFRQVRQAAPHYVWPSDRVFVSTAQGYSLGLNSGFYPYTTCRECTVQQALADANIPARRLRKVIATYRTYPIRVGSTSQGSSGPCYSDQVELDWATLGVQPETTTVTGRQRRIFTWSHEQFVKSMVANEPDALFLNFINYLPTQEAAMAFVKNAWETYCGMMHKSPDFVMLGMGAYHHDVAVAFTLQEAYEDIAAKWRK